MSIIFSVTVTAPSTPLDRKSAEAVFVLKALAIVGTEFGRWQRDRHQRHHPRHGCGRQRQHQLGFVDVHGLGVEPMRDTMSAMEEYFPTDEQIEARAVSHAFGLLAAVGDADVAKVRLEQIVAATARYADRLAAAEKFVAEADIRRAAIEQADADLAKRTEAFQTWVDGTRRTYQDREARILQNEDAAAKREAALVTAEAAHAAKVAAHENMVRQMRAHLGDAA